MKQKNNDEEIDLIQIFIIIWNNKWKVILPPIFSVISIILYYQINHEKLNSQLIYAKTKIETISTFESMLLGDPFDFLSNVPRMLSNLPSCSLFRQMYRYGKDVVRLKAEL